MVGVIVYAHGFGVRSDARGMFTAIRDTLTNYHHVFVDLNDIDENGAITVSPINEQVMRLHEAIARAHDAYPMLPITVIAHSQGCAIAALTVSAYITRAILLAPPYTISVKRIQERYARIEITVDPSTTSYIPRRDGTTTRILPEYFKSIESLNPIALYNDLATRVPTTIIIAKDDDVIDNTERTNYNLVSEVIEIPGDHDFTKESRDGMVQQINTLLK